MHAAAAASAEAAPSAPDLSQFSKERAAMSDSFETSLPPVAVQASVVAFTAGVVAVGAGREQGRALGAAAASFEREEVWRRK